MRSQQAKSRLVGSQADLGEGAKGYSRPDGVAGESQKRYFRARSDTSPDALVSADDIVFVRGTRDATQLVKCCGATW